MNSLAESVPPAPMPPSIPAEPVKAPPAPAENSHKMAPSTAVPELKTQAAPAPAANVDQTTVIYKDYCKLYFANIFFVNQVCLFPTANSSLVFRAMWNKKQKKKSIAESVAGWKNWIDTENGQARTWCALCCTCLFTAKTCSHPTATKSLGHSNRSLLRP